eukprot:TRINITY_DN9843_c0_g1_i1.p1 TRINITY_DN9843_c0_g1~~TRINITY_DN9843_c0_g1_i1.p1  ORF type:complete len:380 (+),score=110.60 TRINITY_DN9843_c0_g1_i1:56-1195(+)
MVVRHEGLPLFCAAVHKRGTTAWLLYNATRHVFEPTATGWLEDLLAQGNALKPVKVVVYRQFTIHEITKRVIEDVEGARLIVPDYDGLAYAADQEYPASVIDLAASDETNVNAMVEYFEQRARARQQLRMVPGMGLVTPQDEVVVNETRALTDWKQNHGMETANLFKTQELEPGNYVCMSSDGTVRILPDAAAIFEAYRDLWAKGVPLPLNPKWPVHIDELGLPVYDEKREVYDPRMDWAKLHDQLRKRRSRWTIASLEALYAEQFPEDRIVAKKVVFEQGQVRAPEVQTFIRLKDEERVQQRWLELRQLQLQPVVVLHRNSAERCEAPVAALIDRLFPQVFAKLKAKQDRRVAALTKVFSEERFAFFLKHKVECPVTL